MPDDARDCYLAELEQLLPFPRERREEILEEINTHLDDAVDDRRARGIPADRAETDAQARLGPPRDLARDLARPEQSAMRLLAAAGAGVRTGTLQWLYGYFFGGFVLYAVIVVIAASIALGARALQLELTFPTDRGWNTLGSAGAIAIGLFFAGRSMPEAVSVTSRQPLSDVRPWVVVILTTLAFIVMVLLVEVPHNWPSSVAFTVAPAAVALGAYRPGLLPRWFHLQLRMIVTLFVIIPLMGLLSYASGGWSSDVDVSTNPPDRNLSMAGPWWPAALEDGAPLFSSNGWSQQADGVTRYEWVLHEGQSLDRLSDLRAEAWRSTTGHVPTLDPAHRAPFATAAIHRSGDMLIAELDTTNEPGLVMWELVVTGVDPEGARYVLDAGTILSGTFEGSVWDWFVAVTR